jgi:hypothetical protein
LTARATGESEDMILGRDDNLRGVDDFVAEIALAKRARPRLAGMPSSLCGLRFTHPREPTQFDARGFLVVDTCGCILPSDHDDACMCGHNIERRVYRVDANGREHYATRPLASGSASSRLPLRLRALSWLVARTTFSALAARLAARVR